MDSRRRRCSAALGVAFASLAGCTALPFVGGPQRGDLRIENNTDRTFEVGVTVSVDDAVVEHSMTIEPGGWTRLDSRIPVPDEDDETYRVTVWRDGETVLEEVLTLDMWARDDIDSLQVLFRRDGSVTAKFLIPR